MARDLESSNEILGDTLFRCLPGVAGVIELSGKILRSNAELSSRLEPSKARNDLRASRADSFFELFSVASRAVLQEQLRGVRTGVATVLFDLELLENGAPAMYRWQVRALEKFDPASESRYLVTGTPLEDLRPSGYAAAASVLPIGMLIVNEDFTIDSLATARTEEILCVEQLVGKNVIDAVFKLGWERLTDKERLAVEGLGDFFGGDVDRFELLIDFFPKRLELSHGAFTVTLHPLVTGELVDRLLIRFEKAPAPGLVPDFAVAASASGKTGLTTSGDASAMSSGAASANARRLEEIKRCPSKLIYLAEKELGAFSSRIGALLKNKDARALLSQLHGLKGTSRLVGLVSIGDRVHELETELATEPARKLYLSGGFDAKLGELMTELDETRRQFSVVHGKTGLAQKDTSDRNHGSVQQLFASFNQLMAIKPGLGSAVASERIDWAIRSTERVSIDELEQFFVNHVGAAATETQKQVSVQWNCEAMPIDEESRRTLTQVLTHLSTNAVVHGIEDSAARKTAGKPATGTVRATIHFDGTTLHGKISDDGRGIDPSALRASALRKGVRPQLDLEAMTEVRLVDLIFDPGFSTTDRVTKLSGRGVGLDAVRQALRKLGGDVRVKSGIGTGTEFEFWLSPPSIRLAKKRFITYKALHDQLTQATRFQTEHEGLSIEVDDSIDNASDRETGLLHVDDIQLLMAVTGVVGHLASSRACTVKMKVAEAGDVSFEVALGEQAQNVSLPSQYAILKESFEVWIRVNGGHVTQDGEGMVRIGIGGSIASELLPVIELRATPDLQAEDFEAITTAVNKAARAMGFTVLEPGQATGSEKITFTAAYATYEPKPEELVVRYRQSAAEIKPLIMAAMEKRSTKAKA